MWITAQEGRQPRGQRPCLSYRPASKGAEGEPRSPLPGTLSETAASESTGRDIDRSELEHGVRIGAAIRGEQQRRSRRAQADAEQEKDHGAH